MVTSAHLLCTRCGTDNPERAAFCLACGYPLRFTPGQPDPHSLTGLLAPSHVLNQRYRILSQVGKGGFGAVYKAEDTLLGDRPVAVKEMGQSWLSPEEVVIATEVFKREAILLASLAHPGLPRIYDQFYEGSHWYLVMDFIEGETLDERMRKIAPRRLFVDEILAISIQLCTVLDYLHTRQPPIVFRDLKPSNIMLTPGGAIFLIDFGIARHFKPGQLHDTVAFGSPGYAPPEQYGKGQTTPRADIYSLGATLHQMFTGHDPANTPFRFPQLRLPPRLAPPGLDAFIMGMLDMDEALRPPTMAIVQETLQRFADAWEAGKIQSIQPRVLYAQPSSRITTGSGQPAQAVALAAPPAITTSPDIALRTYRGHSARVLVAAWSADSKYIASGGNDCTVQVWNAETGSTLFIYLGHKEWVKTLAWSPGSTRVASAGADATVQIWDALTGAVPFIYRGHTNIVSALAWSPGGTYIASAGYDKTFQVWNAVSGEQCCWIHDHEGIVNAVAWSPDGSHLATASDDHTVRVWAITQRGSPASKTPVYTYHGHGDKVSCVAWSPDGKRIASGSWDNTVHVWDPTSGSYVFVHHSHTSWINAVAWSSSSARIASASNDATVQVWEASNGREFFSKRSYFTFYGHTEWVRDVAWSPNGRYIASCGHDQTVQIWQAP